MHGTRFAPRAIFMPDISTFIRALPKAELHLHLEGTVLPATLAELSRRHPTPLPIKNNRYASDPRSGHVLSVDDVEKLYSYEDFTGFLLAFKAVTERMRTADDYELVTYEMLRQLSDQGVLYAEAFVSVGVVLWRGQDFAPLFAGMERGRERGERDFGVDLQWIFDAVRHFPVEEAQKVVELAIRFKDRHVVGIGIGGDERQGGADRFREIYRHAADAGLRLSAHAGETVGPDSIWAAINIGAERLGHGLHAIEDQELVETLAERQIPVEICITSNFRTGCCLKLEDHPVRRLFDAGVMITLNSDDPAMFRTSLCEEYALAQEVFGFSEDQLRELARNSFEASFLEAKAKLYLLDKVDSFA